MKRTVTLFVLMAFLLAAVNCASWNKTTRGAVIGGAGGAVLGGVIGRAAGNTLLGAILGAETTRRTTLEYKLTVENYKSKKINVKLFEAMPFSEDDRIKVKIEKVSMEPKEKDWKDRKGVWLWELELEPKAKKEITYTYTVEHPRQMQVEGL